MGARTGDEFLLGLRESSREVYIEGELVRDVTEHPGDGPVLIHRKGERVVVQSFDERAQTLALFCVRSHVRAIAVHA